MVLKEILLQRKPEILRRWFALIIETYPPDARNFFQSEKDPFANPVGGVIRREIESIFDELLEGSDPENLSLFLDRIIRIRAVQDFKPAQSIVFVFLLKQVVREQLEKFSGEGPAVAELLEFETRVDRLALIAFNIYMDCREQVYRIRADEVRSQSAKLLERLGLASGYLAEEGDIEDAPDKQH